MFEVLRTPTQIGWDTLLTHSCDSGYYIAQMLQVRVFCLLGIDGNEILSCALRHESSKEGLMIRFLFTTFAGVLRFFH